MEVYESNVERALKSFVVAVKELSELEKVYAPVIRDENGNIIFDEDDPKFADVAFGQAVELWKKILGEIADGLSKYLLVFFGVNSDNSLAGFAKIEEAKAEFLKAEKLLHYNLVYII